MRLATPAFTSFFKNKKLKIYIISISITFGMVISIIYSLYLVNNVFADRIKNNIINRVLFVSKETETQKEDIEELNSMDNVEYAYTQLISFSMQLNEEDLNVKYRSTQELPELTLGESFNDREEAQILLPEKIFDRKNEEIKYNELLGKYVTLELEDFEIEAKVIGLYDSKYFIKEMYINDYFREKLIEYNEKVESKDRLFLIVNDYRNVDSMIEILKAKKEYSANLSDSSGQSDIKIYNMATILIIAILCLTVLFTYISISIMISGIISDEKMDISILKAIGYKVKDISTIMKYRVMTILGISFVIGIIISTILTEIIKMIINWKLDVLLKNDFKIYGLLLFVFVIGIYIIAIISIKLNNRKIKKINTIELLKEN